MDEGSPPSPDHASWTVRVARSREGRGRDFKRRAALSQQRIEDEGAFLTWRGDRITLGIETAFRSRILGRTWHRRAVRLRQLRSRRRDGSRPRGRFERSGAAAPRQRQSARKQCAERKNLRNSAHSDCATVQNQPRPFPSEAITSQRRGDIVSDQTLPARYGFLPSRLSQRWASLRTFFGAVPP